MFRCHVCGAAEVRTELVNEVFVINDKFVLVENIPATVCGQCGEKNFQQGNNRKNPPYGSR